MNSNYLGTYTFDSLAAYQAGQPTSYTRRIGDPNVDLYHVTSAVYVQDDIRVRKNLTLSPGLRYEVQTHVRDYNNLGPRFGMTWAPFKSGKTTFRGSAGIFYDWLNQNTLEQVIRVDGSHQQEVNLVNPSSLTLARSVGAAVESVSVRSRISRGRGTPGSQAASTSSSRRGCA